LSGVYIYMMQFSRIIQNSRTLKALIGMSTTEFEDLLVKFSCVLDRHALKKPRKRAIGGGFKGVLDTQRKKLFFVLFYLKVYPTFDVLGALFAKPRGRSCEAIHLFLPLLEQALGEKCVLPERRISSLAEFRQRFPEISDVMLGVAWSALSSAHKTISANAATTLARRRVTVVRTW
jgi:Helix-turn-helix of DDE superfamily endonuclease